MARYSIDGQILTDIADSIRTAIGKEDGVPGGLVEAVYEFSDQGNNSDSLDHASNAVDFLFKVPGASYVLVKDIVITADTTDELYFKIGYYMDGRYNNLPGPAYRVGSDDTPKEFITIPSKTNNNLFFVAVRSPIENTNINISLTAIGMDENQNVLVNKEAIIPYGITPEQMPDEIRNIENTKLFKGLVDRSITTITAKDLEGITTIGFGAFSNCARLTSLELPEGIYNIESQAFEQAPIQELTFPRSVCKISSYTFSNARFPILTMLNTETCVDVYSGNQPIVDGGSLSAIQQVRVPGILFDDYLANKTWSALHTRMVPYDEYIPSSFATRILEYNQSNVVSVPLTNFDYVPEYSMSAPEGITITDINATNTEITFTINSGEVEGTYPISIEITTQSGYTFTRTLNVKVISEFIEGTYTVSNPSNHTYTFILNGNGYYESNNQKQSNSFARCRININNPMGQTVYIDCINYAEANYDYGLIGNVNEDCSAYTVAKMESNAQYSFKSKSHAGVQTITYNNAVDECFIDVMYKKDGSGDNNNDSLQFQVRFG